MDNPFASAFEKSENKYLALDKKELIKLCKAKDIPAEYGNELEDLAFLLFRLDYVSNMSAKDLTSALEGLGFPSKSKKVDAIQLITFELCLVDLINSDERDISSLCQEYEVLADNLTSDEVLLKLAVQMCI